MATSIPPKRRAQFFRELAQLTKSGISVTKAAKVLGQDWRGGEVRRAVTQMETGIAAGLSIAGALQPNLTSMEHSIIEAAERGGQLAQGFRHLEEYYQLLDKTHDKVRNAVLYPLCILHAAVLLPAIVAAVTTKTSVLMAIAVGLALIWGFLAILWWGGRWVGRLAERHEAVDRFLGWIPLVAPARQALALARWHAVFHFTIASSQRISDGLRQAGMATQRFLLAKASHRAAQSVEDGSELGPALLAQSAFPREMSATLASAEFSGNLDTETLRCSRESMSEAAITLENSSQRLCRLLYGVVVILIAWQILQMAGMVAGQYQKAFTDLGF